MNTPTDYGYTYDPSRNALFHPGRSRRFFLHGRPEDPAALCAEMARLTYVRDQRQITNFLSAIGFKIVGVFFRSQTFGILAQSSDIAVLAFRGTDVSSFTDLRLDLEFWPTPWNGGGRVHSGFNRAFRHLWKDVKNSIEALNVPFLVTGHSLGASIATLVAASCNPAAVYTFGSPHVGDDEFGETLSNVEIHRYVDCADLVTRVPPWFFQHVGRLHYINHLGEIVVDPDFSLKEDREEGRRAYRQAYGFDMRNNLFRDMADHAPINYVTPLMMRSFETEDNADAPQMDGPGADG